MGYSLLIMQIFMSVSMSLLWGLMHTMQVIIYMRMLNVLLPVNARIVFSFIEKLASFKIGKQIRNYLVNLIFTWLKTPDSEEDDDSTIDGAQNTQQDFIENLKLLLFGLVVFVTLASILIVAYIFRNKFFL